MTNIRLTDIEDEMGVRIVDLPRTSKKSKVLLFLSPTSGVQARPTSSKLLNRATRGGKPDIKLVLIIVEIPQRTATGYLHICLETTERTSWVQLAVLHFRLIWNTGR